VITSRRDEEEDMPEEMTPSSQGDASRDLAGHELPAKDSGDEGLGPGDTSAAPAGGDDGLAAHERMIGDQPVDEDTRHTDGGQMGSGAALSGHSMGVAAPPDDPAFDGAEQMPPYEQSSSSDT
jgi:hypothetical protein